MFSEDIINLIRFGIGFIVLVFGSVTDIRTRRVPNRLWLISGAIASVILLVSILKEDPTVFSAFFTIPAIFYFYYFYSDPVPEKDGRKVSFIWMGLALISLVLFIGGIFRFNVPANLSFLLLATFVLFAVNETLLLFKGVSSRFSWLILFLLCFITLFFLSLYDPVSNERGLAVMRGELPHTFLLITSVLLILTVIYSLYNAGIIMGGADAKALMFLSILAPAYPVVASLTVNTNSFLIMEKFPFQTYLFPFSLTTLINGALLLVLYPLFFLGLNIVRGDIDLPKSLFGYRLAPEDFEKRFVWLLEVEKDGKRKMRLKPLGNEEKEKEQIERFKDLGVKRIWVQPKIPFLVLMLLGYLIAVVFGNVLHLIIYLFSDLPL